MHSYLEKKLEGHVYLTLMQLQQMALVQENWSKNTKEFVRPSHREVHFVDNSSHSSDDESNDVLTAEFIWPSKVKLYTCDALKTVHKNQPDDFKYTFDVAKCDKNFDELHKGGYIKFYHTLPPPEEPYCKWHYSFSHATKDCNVFHRQVQLAIKEG